jgi:hypothetical protein
MVIGKISIDFTEQLNDLTTQRSENARRTGTRNTIARIHHNLHGPAELNATDNALNVGRQNIC